MTINDIKYELVSYIVKHISYITIEILQKILIDDKLKVLYILQSDRILLQQKIDTGQIDELGIECKNYIERFLTFVLDLKGDDLQNFIFENKVKSLDFLSVTLMDNEIEKLYNRRQILMKAYKKHHTKPDKKLKEYFDNSTGKKITKKEIINVLNIYNKFIEK